jgi:hypothetical protein
VAAAAPSTAALAAAVVTPGAATSAPGEGQPEPAPISAGAVLVARADAGAPTPAAGGPATAGEAAAGNPSSELAAAAIQRAAATEAAPGEGQPGGGQPDADPAARMDRQLARQVGGGGPQLALAGPNPADLAVALPGQMPAGGGAEGGPAPGPEANPEASTTERMVGGGAPSTGRPAEFAEAGPAAGASGGEVLAAQQYTRAEAVEAATGNPTIGGGTGSPARAASGSALAANVRAETLELAGMADSGGIDNGSPLAAQGLEAARLPGGAPSAPAAGPVGAAEDLETADVAMTGGPGSSLARRTSSPGNQPSPEVGQANEAGLPLTRAGQNRLPSGTTAVAMVDLPSTGSMDAVAQATMDHLGQIGGDVAMSRQSTEGGLSVNLDAPAGSGGLGDQYTADVGLNNRRALSESTQVQVHTTRFVRHDVGGVPNFSTGAVISTEPFQRRSDRPGEGAGGGTGSPPPKTEESVELGLAFLARHQNPDGSWSLQGIPNEPAALVTDTGATALALLAFQGAGYNHREHRYAELVNGAIQYLLKNQKEDGDLFIPLDDESNQSVWLYSHSLATLALCEAYGMTQDPSLREPAQKAVDFLVKAQHSDRGGWRYSPQYGSDTSVTGWAMMAIKSGELANLKVPPETYAKIRRWLDNSQGSASEPHLYRYNPYAPDTTEQRHGRDTSKTMTSVGLLMRLYLGWHRDHANMVRGAEYLKENLPTLGSEREPERDTYYWYYATQVMFHMGGDYWKAWNDRLHPLLVNSQIKRGPMAGSWDPRRPLPDRWAPHAGRLYVTTLNLLSLEVYYRHLPLYVDTAK